MRLTRLENIDFNQIAVTNNLQIRYQNNRMFVQLDNITFCNINQNCVIFEVPQNKAQILVNVENVLLKLVKSKITDNQPYTFVGFTKSSKNNSYLKLGHEEIKYFVDKIKQEDYAITSDTKCKIIFEIIELAKNNETKNITLVTSVKQIGVKAINFDEYAFINSDEDSSDEDKKLNKIEDIDTSDEKSNEE